MPTIKISRRALAEIEPGEKPVIYYDNALKGFGLKVMPTGAKSWIIEYRPGAGGRGVSKKRIKIGTLATHSPEAAREEASRTLARVTLGSDPAAARTDERKGQVVAAVAETWLEEHVLIKRKPKTYNEYKLAVERYIKPVLGSLKFALVEPSDVLRMQAKIIRGKVNKANGGRTMANRALATLSAIYGWAQDLKIVPLGFNPVTSIERFKENQIERFLTSEEIGSLATALTEAETIGLPYEVDETKAKAKHANRVENRRTVYGEHAIAAIRLYLFTGCRRSEILRLTWSDVDLERGILFLPDSKTGKKPVILSPQAQAILTNLTRVGKYVIAGADAGTKDEAPRADIDRPWKAVTRRAGLHKLRLHDLRHTYASIGAGGGQGLPIIGKLLGHKNIATTQRYAHLDTNPMKRVAGFIGDHISQAMEDTNGKAS
ncbi:tyrosine-type recombinase/integrase [Rhizobium rhizogenes]|uniref:Tyrosine site-specific integrase/recombinase protein n=1 Tax=Rhizobium rhizogenes (strain K84 / ATCC BAA-868) TaxID=311403 RepID=B9JF62_RHIR8|nr:tyrosine site-specific integrase/recombinase protein [Rhizobium rhizogenes K84]